MQGLRLQDFKLKVYSKESIFGFRDFKFKVCGSGIHDPLIHETLSPGIGALTRIRRLGLLKDQGLSNRQPTN